jgi:hypothetical protein
MKTTFWTSPDQFILVRTECVFHYGCLFQVFTKLLKKHQKESDTLTKRLVKVATCMSKTIFKQ